MSKVGISFKGMSLSTTTQSKLTSNMSTDPGMFSMYDGLTKSELTLPKPAKKGETRYVEDKNKRQEVRRNRYFGIVTKAADIKALSGDDVMVVVYNSDRQCYSVVSTNMEKLNFNPNHPEPEDETEMVPDAIAEVVVSTEGEEEDPLNVDEALSTVSSRSDPLESSRNSSASNDPFLGPALADLSTLRELLDAAPTPMRPFPRQMTARKFDHKRRNSCRICKQTFVDAQNIALDRILSLIYLPCKYR